MTYYDRQAVAHLDGSPIFKTSEDEDSENIVAETIASAWHCQLRSFGRLAPIDWYAERDGRLVGVLELKTRSHPSHQYPTVFLNVRKWLALTLAAVGLDVPALFIVRFTDGIWWTPTSDLDATGAKIGGCLRIVKSRSDVEPIIEVPVDSMRRLQS